jgi:hypothetical protein
MQNPRWVVDSLLVGAATLAVVVGATRFKPTEASAIWVSGGAAGIGAFSGSAVMSRRRQQSAQTALRQTTQLQEILIHQIQPLIEDLQQKLDQSQLSQVELKQQAQSTRDRTRNLETQLEQLRNALPASPASLAVSPASPISPVSPKVVLPPGKPKPIKKTRFLDEFGSKYPERAIQWLTERDISVVRSHNPDQLVDDHYNRLANYLGDHYAALKELLRTLKQAMHSPSEPKRHTFRFAPATISDVDFQLCYHFCKQLKTAFLLESCSAPPNSKRLQGKVNPDAKDFRAFLDGTWFERFVYQKMTQSLTDKGLDYACLLNPQISYPGTPAAELDMFFLIEGQPLSIECKSGQYTLEAARIFAKHSEKLGLSPQTAIFVTLDVPDTEIKLQNRQVESITLMTSDQLVAHLEGVVLTLEAAAEQTPGIVLRTQTDTELLPSASALRKVKQRPIKAHRASILDALTQLFRTPQIVQEPAPSIVFVDLKNMLSARVGISKAQVNDVLQVMKHAGYFLDEQGLPVPSITQPITTLRSLDPVRTEQIFVEEYTRKVLALDINFLDDAANRQQFEATVGAPVPDDETLDRLKDELFEDQDADELDG